MLTADEVTEALLPRLKRYNTATQSLEVVADFVNAKPVTVADWLRGRQAPTGERMIKLWYFLEEAGAPSPEIQALDPYNRYAGELYAFGLVDLDDLSKIFNVKNPQAVYNALRGRLLMHPTRLLEDLVPCYDEELQKAKKKVTRVDFTLPAPDLHQDSSVDESPLQNPAPHGAPLAPDVTTLALQLASSLQEGLVTLRYLDSDVCSQATRDLVLDLTGGLLEFSTYIDCIRSR